MTRLLSKAAQAHNVNQLPYFPVIASEWNERGDPDKNQKRNIYYPGLRSNGFADIASLSLAMTFYHLQNILILSALYIYW